MPATEKERSALLRAVAQSLGQEAADTLSELLPDAGARPATKRDIDNVLAVINAMDERLTGEIRHLAARLDGTEQRFDGLEQRFGGLEQRFDGLEQRLDGTEQRFDGLEQRFDGLEQRFDGLEQRFDGLEQRFDGLETRFDGLEERFDGLERRIGGLETRFDGMDARFEQLSDRMTATLERRLGETITTQTRMLVFTQLGAVMAIAALVLGLR